MREQKTYQKPRKYISRLIYGKNEPLDKELYNEIKDRVWKMYDKPSAYRSGMLVKLYREAGGKYSGDKDKDAPLNLSLIHI